MAACIFLAVQDEYIAYAIFRKLFMGDSDWRRFYITDMPKLMEMTETVKQNLSIPVTNHFIQHSVFLET